jgi:hypothetical protein
MNFRYTKMFCFATPLVALIAVIVAGGGHGSPAPMLLVYPAVFAIGDFVEDFVISFIMVFQLPLYGLIIDFATSKSKSGWGWAIVGLTQFVFFCIAISNGKFAS